MRQDFRIRESVVTLDGRTACQFHSHPDTGAVLDGEGVAQEGDLVHHVQAAAQLDEDSSAHLLKDASEKGAEGRPTSVQTGRAI